MQTDNVIFRLEKKGVKPTTNRILVFETLAQEVHPVSLTELVDLISTMDKSSIFRVLTLFVEHDVIHCIEDGSGSAKYELCQMSGRHTMSDGHVHFYCERCHQISCFDDIHIPQVPVPEGYSPHAVNYVIKGICPKCCTK